MTLAIRHAWLQKHPSPAAASGEFHWYPADGDRELRASYVERARGVEPAAVLWELAPGRASWAQLFTATAPIDGRRYTGLVLTIVEGVGASVAELLEAFELPPPEPCTQLSAGPAPSRAVADGADDRTHQRSRVLRRHGSAPPVVGAPEPTLPRVRRPSEPAQDRDDAWREVAAIARALLSDGPALVMDPYSAELPRHAASIERLLPAATQARTRRGTWCASGAGRGGASGHGGHGGNGGIDRNRGHGEHGEHGGHAGNDRVAELVADAWRDPGSRSARAWTILCELAASRERGVDEIAAELASADSPERVLTDAERAALGGARDFAMTLHAWGRGRLDRSPTAGTLPDRLADALALRVLASLIAGREPSAVMAEARWHALLPADRRLLLLDTFARRGASLRALLGGLHA